MSRPPDPEVCPTSPGDKKSHTETKPKTGKEALPRTAFTQVDAALTGGAIEPIQVRFSVN